MQITSNTIFISWNYQFILLDCFFLLPSWSFIDASALVLFCFLPFLSSFPWWKSHSLHACRGAVFLRALEFSSVILHFLFLGNLFSWKDHSFLHSVSTFSLHLFLSTQSALKLLCSFNTCPFVPGFDIYLIFSQHVVFFVSFLSTVASLSFPILRFLSSLKFGYSL